MKHEIDIIGKFSMSKILWRWFCKFLDSRDIEFWVVFWSLEIGKNLKMIFEKILDLGWKTYTILPFKIHSIDPKLTSHTTILLKNVFWIMKYNSKECKYYGIGCCVFYTLSLSCNLSLKKRETFHGCMGFSSSHAWTWGFISTFFSPSTLLWHFGFSTNLSRWHKSLCT